MTNEQEHAIAFLKREILLHDGLGKNNVDKYEYKKFEITKMDNFNSIFLYTEVGMKNDEGTMASLLCRKKRYIRIGPRGGLRLINGKKKNITGRRVIWELTKY